jgi:hypothetical protein
VIYNRATIREAIAERVCNSNYLECQNSKPSQSANRYRAIDKLFQRSFSSSFDAGGGNYELQSIMQQIEETSKLQIDCAACTKNTSHCKCNSDSLALTAEDASHCRMQFLDSLEFSLSESATFGSLEIGLI